MNWPRERLMRVTADGKAPFVAGAIWLNIGGEWMCVTTAPILAWMRGLTPHEAIQGIERRRLKWEWVRNKARS